MKQFFFICLLLSISCLCHAQSDLESQPDSMSLQSRYTADVVLSYFDTLSGKKMLYSLRDREYVIIVQSYDQYKSFVLSINDDSSISQMKEVDINREYEILSKQKFLSWKKRKRLRHLKDQRQAIIDAFVFDDEPSPFITSFPDAEVLLVDISVPSYFVIKDEENIRYREYCFSTYTVPCPINPNLWVCLMMTIVHNLK